MIRSMTGYGRFEGVIEGRMTVFEIKAVMLEGEYPGPRRGEKYLDATLYALDFLFRTPPAKIFTFGVKPEVLGELESYARWLIGRTWDHKFRSLQILEVLQ